MPFAAGVRLVGPTNPLAALDPTMTDTDDLWRRPAHEIADAVRTGRLSAVRVAESALARLDAVDEAQVRAVAAELFSQDTCLAVVGPYRESDLDRL